MRQMTALIKPASSLCNLRCSYCFYCDEVKARTGSSARIMSAETTTQLIRKVFDFCKEGSSIHFMFQGGEPLIAGIEYFRNFIQTTLEHKDPATKISYALQTNGTLINEEFCELFREHSFLIGVSLDGDEALHNKNRCGSYSKAMAGIALLRQYNVDFNVLSVITSQSDAKKLWNFYKRNHFHNVQPIYCLDPLDGTKGCFSLDSTKLATFQKKFFDLWYQDTKKGLQISVRDFDNLLTLFQYGHAEQCGATGRCTPQLVVEADGTCYPCDFYCLDSFECLNINVASIADILRCQGLQTFLSYDEPKNSLCPTCPVAPICGGGCKRYRSLYNQIPGYCPRKDFLLHAIETLRNAR